jgi:hypothetical protein
VLASRLLCSMDIMNPSTSEGESSAYRIADRLRLRRGSGRGGGVGVGGRNRPGHTGTETSDPLSSRPVSSGHATLYPPPEKSRTTYDKQSLPESDRQRPVVSQLWLQSRLIHPPLPNSTTSYTPRGEDRPLTLRNIKIALRLRLGLHLWRRFLLLFWEGRKLRITGYLVRRLIRGSIPALKYLFLRTSEYRLIGIFKQTLVPESNAGCRTEEFRERSSG